jgi:DNA-binding NarL/FixJ family response regulator
VVGDRRLYLEALCEFLAGIPGFDPWLVPVIPSGPPVDHPAPDVVLVDCPAGDDGAASVATAVGALAECYPGSRTLLLTSGTDRESGEQTAAAGAGAWASLTLSLADLVRLLDDDKAATGHAVASKLTWPLSELSEREVAVVRLIAGGQPTAEIASTLGISPHTVRTHVQNAMAKMGVRSRTQMLSVAVRAGLRASHTDRPSKQSP